MKKCWRKVVSVFCLMAMLSCSCRITYAADITDDGTDNGVVPATALGQEETVVPEDENTGNGSDEEGIAQTEEDAAQPEDDSSQSDEEAGQPAGTDGQPEETEEPEAENQEQIMEVEAGVKYSAHMQSSGWKGGWKEQGQEAGAGGGGKRMEALMMELVNAQSGDSIEYRAHVQGIGWQKWVSNGAVSGTIGLSKRVEAVQIRLKGDIAQKYDVFYQAYSANFGWLGWAQNEQIAGSTGWGYPMEALKVVLVRKGEPAPGSTDNHYKPALWEVNYNQAGETTSVSVDLPAIDQIIADNAATDVSVTATMNYNGKATRTVSCDKKISSIKSEGLTLDFGNYGKHNVEIRFLKNGQVVATKTQSVGVKASAYNLAPISATFPVVMFSLSLWDITKGGSGQTVPTIVMLGRPSAYNWNSLPSGVYAMPYLTKADIQKRADYTAFQAYVKDLYEISPDAKFNLYINDITCSYIHSVIYANKIPEGQYTITLMSDGSATYNIFNETYANSNAKQKHNQLIATWNEAKKRVYSTGTVGNDWGWHKHWDCMYAVLSCEPGTQWWVARNNLFASGDSSFTEQVKNDVVVKSVGSMLSALQAKGDGTVQEFKALYDFNDGYFEDTDKYNKKAMMILGTYVTLEKNFKDYANLTKLYYGDDYLYYYKGHPNTPTGLYPSKSAELDELGITDVDSSIAAELILFFNPDISLSGYETSTFNSASDEMACGLYNIKKSAALATGAGVNYKGIDWFASPINKNNTDAEILALCPEGSTCYLVELSDAILAEGVYDFAVYNATKDELTFYKKSGNKYEAVKVLNNEKQLEYATHVQSHGWQDPVKEGGISGTVGSAKRLEGITIKNISSSVSGGVEYRSHVQTYGWEKDWKSNGDTSGTVGQSKRLEAIQIRLTGEMAEQYDIYYRVHVQTFGWLDWAKNGESAGSEGYAKRLEAIQIKLVGKGGRAPGKTDDAYRKIGIGYRTHVQTHGWQSYVYDGAVSGTEGSAKRLEGINIKNMDTQTSGDVRYRTHIQSIGWEKGWKKNGQMSGTQGRAKRLEAIQIELTGDLAKKYDVYYRVHVQSYGWLDWAKNGESAGTEGLSKRLEAIEIKYVAKGKDAPGETDRVFIKK